jgi:dCTP diphosphatase
MSDANETIGELRQMVERFVAERHWQPFHTPKNLSMALAIEAAELMEHFQWLDAAESRGVAEDAERRDQVADELADVLCYALALANSLGIEVGDAMRKKMIKNAQKYPADEYRGRWGADDRRPPTQ